MKKLVSELCRREGLKSQTSIGNIREIMKHFVSIFVSETEEDKKLIEEFLFDLSKKMSKKYKREMIIAFMTYAKEINQPPVESKKEETQSQPIEESAKITLTKNQPKQKRKKA